MSKPRYDWWPYAKGMIRRYPKMLAELEELKRTSVTPNYDQIGHGYDLSRPTEKAALRQLPAVQQRELEAVRAALEKIKHYENAKERMTMIELIFWKRSHTIDGVAMKLHYSWRTVAGWHRELIYDVARNYGLLD